MSSVLRRILPLVAALAMVCAIGPQTGITHASGRTLAVTTAADTSCTNGFLSLRCAIGEANSDGSGDTIIFQIATTAVTITLRSALPAVTASNTLIDGYLSNTEGSTPNNDGFTVGDDAVINVTLNGSAVTSGADGLVIEGSNDTVRGLRIVGFEVGGNANGGYGVALMAPVTSGPPITVTGDVVEGNFIGNVNRSAVITPNTNGVGIFAGNVGATIGGGNGDCSGSGGGHATPMSSAETSRMASSQRTPTAL